MLSASVSFPRTIKVFIDQLLMLVNYVLNGEESAKAAVSEIERTAKRFLDHSDLG
jgi:hypothetical protein